MSEINKTIINLEYRLGMTEFKCSFKIQLGDDSFKVNIKNNKAHIIPPPKPLTDITISQTFSINDEEGQ